MAVTAGQFTITFDKVNNVFILTDTTDYVGQGKPLTDVYGNFKILAPSGIVIHNNTSAVTPDIDADVSLISNTIPLPMDSNKEVLCGAYSFTYTITDTSDGSTTVVVSPLSYVYKSPEISIAMSVDCAKPELTSEDETNYLVSGVLPTTKTFDHNLYYPPTTGASTINAASDIITTNTFYTLKNVGLQHSSDLTVDLVYDYPTYSVIDQIEGNEFINVICDPGLCDIFCGLYSLWNKYINTKGGSCGNEYLDMFVRLTSATSLIRQAYSCGQSEKVPAIIEEIKSQGNFADECCCDDDSTAPILVTGVGATSTTVVTAGTGIVVSGVVAGTTTTYTVSIDPSLLNLINNATNSVVSSGLSTTVTPVTVGNTTTYTVDVTYSLVDNSIPVYDSTSQQLQDSVLTWDGTVLKALSLDLDLRHTSASALKQSKLNIEATTGGDDPEGNVLSTTEGTGVHRVVNGEWTSTGVFGSGIDYVQAGVLKGYNRLYTPTNDLVHETVLLPGTYGSSLYGTTYSKVSNPGEVVEQIIGTGITQTSSTTIVHNSITHNTPLVRVDSSRAINGSDYFKVDNAITVRQEASGVAIAIGDGTIPGDYTSVIVGDSAIATGAGSVSLGNSANSVAYTDATTVGSTATSGGNNSVSVGYSALAGASGIAIGNDPTADDNSIAIGVTATALSSAIVIGKYTATSGNAVTIGNGTSAVNQLVNGEVKSLLVGFSDVVADKLLHIGRTQTENYMGGSGTFEFSNQDSGLAQNSKWNFHDGDVEVVNLGSGIVIKSPDGTRYRLTIQNAGAGVTITAA